VFMTGKYLQCYVVVSRFRHVSRYPRFTAIGSSLESRNPYIFLSMGGGHNYARRYRENPFAALLRGKVVKIGILRRIGERTSWIGSWIVKSYLFVGKSVKTH
jgi:hypothetical protein